MWQRIAAGIISLLLSFSWPMSQVPTEYQYILEFEANCEDIEQPYQRRGCLYIPSVSLSVAVEPLTEQSANMAQEIIDKENTAVLLLYDYLPQPIIGDHDYQGFDVTMDICVGDEAYLADGVHEVRRYVCTESRQGVNTRASLMLDEMDCTHTKVGDLVLYTCVNIAGDVWITVWKEKI